ncbi:TPA: GtrA family protein [Yersinia enterocolitica]|uniref:GtrA family protein n=1 Tax=Yersinia enterocolitica TaxID=630 RepID=UPI002876391B|nr:GtrA family protein [Yersinia enterocolitica]HDM8434396.1 GtrA family protein [Yersinia enterocolitica]HDW8043133.1 GtrA family protein [Yersinia enterocolitica]HEM6611707.1 GtrA family protein [Yersinia enterocolitica]HEN4724553.1 GtrA family protein [Yersinia enterocolitica]
MKKINGNHTELYSHALVFAKFSLVGGMTMLIYFFFIWLIKSFLGLSYIIAVSVAYFISVLFHFLASKYFTFSMPTLDYGHNIIVRYLLLLLLNYLITVLVVSFCVDKLHFSPYISVCISAVFTIFTGYLLGRYWVFKIKKEIL